ncbi:MAG: methyltransferase domain-containing protein [Phycisphaera sp.]|nr:methyltransferase domain-containing protein [Phycisphaera sp.]
MTDTPCLYCGRCESVGLFPVVDMFGDHYELRRCRGCEARYLCPPPTTQQLARAYDASYYGAGEDKFESTIEKVLGYFRRQRAARLSKALGGHGRVLDLGCGNGEFLKSLMALGDFEAHGIELEGGSAQRAAKVEGLHLKIGTLDVGLYPEAHFDAVTMFHVFEHLPDPARVLDVVGKVLKPGGLLVMSFPNIDSWQARWFKGDWLHLDPPRHLFFFRPADFQKHMADRGYHVLRKRFFSIEYNPFGFQQSLLNRWCGQREVLYEHLKGNTTYAPEQMKHVKWHALFWKLTAPLFVLSDVVESATGRGATVEILLQKTAGPDAGGPPVAG